MVGQAGDIGCYPSAVAIAAVQERYVLGIESVDDTHREFVDQVKRLAARETAGFPAPSGELLEHTRAHFAAEEARMEHSVFPATAEHRADHARVLGDLTRFGERVQPGRTSLARAYVADQLPCWFDLHARTMDSALAAHLSARAASRWPCGLCHADQGARTVPPLPRTKGDRRTRENACSTQTAATS